MPSAFSFLTVRFYTDGPSAQMAAVAELEAGLISQRTRAALAVAKARGVRLGNPSPAPATAEMAAAAWQARSHQVAARATDVLAVVRQVQAEGASSLRAIATALHEQGVRTPSGKEEWSAAQVRRLLAHAEPRVGSPTLLPSA